MSRLLAIFFYKIQSKEEKMFNSIFRDLRNERGISQAEIAKRFNLKQAAVSDWENRGKQPPIETLIKIADYFDVSLDYLCGRTSDVTLPTVEYQRGAELAPRERKLLNDFRQLPDDFQKICLAYLETTRINHGIQKEEIIEK